MTDALQALAQEIVSPDEFEALLARARAAREAERLGPGDPAGKTALEQRPRAYIGFEPSGTAHVGWMVCTQTIRTLYETGFDVTVLLADWHAQINDKLGGDLHAIHRCAEYMTDAFEALGVEKTKVTYRFAREFAEKSDYWALVIQVAKSTTLARMRRAMTIMGRQEDEGDADMSKFLYPAMQVADIFHLEIDLAYGGMDQRHAHMLARDVAKKLGRTPPVAFHTPLVPNLKGGTGRMDPEEVQAKASESGKRQDASGQGEGAPRARGSGVEADAGRRPGEPGGQASTPLRGSAVEAKMSKSDPSSGIFLHDAPDLVEEKLRKAHCPAGQVDDNPVLDLLRLVVWPRLAGGLRVERPEKFGGPADYASYAAVEAAFVAGTLHPMDLKTAVAAALNRILEPVREYFEQYPDNLAFVQGLRRTR